MLLESTIFTEHAQARNAAGQPTTRVQLETVSLRITDPYTHRAQTSLTSLTTRKAWPSAPTGLENDAGLDYENLISHSKPVESDNQTDLIMGEFV